MLQNYIKYNAKTSSKSTQDCSPLLCYRFVSTTLTAQIPTETLSQTHRVCFMLLCYRFATTTLAAQIPNGNAIANSQGLLQAETELRLKKNTEGYRGYKNPLYSL